MGKLALFAATALIVLPLVIGFSGQAPDRASSTDHSSSPSLRYNLVPSYKPGATSFYRQTITLHHLNDDHKVIARTVQRGSFKREVVRLQPDGSAVERITWLSYSVASGDGRTGPEAPEQARTWARNFSYLFSAEQSYSEFHWDFEAIPRTIEGDDFMMHTVNAHFEFDFLRSRTHGAIEKLQRIGDRVRAPDSDLPFEIRMRATPLAWTCTKRDLMTELQGVTNCQGHECAVLYFWTWLDVKAHWGTGAERVDRDGTTQFDGHLRVDTTDGSLWRGDFNEWVLLPLPGSTGEGRMHVYVEYHIERTAEGK